MNFFKNLFIGVTLAIGLTLFDVKPVQAQPHQNNDLLNVQALVTGTNGIGITNLSMLVTNSGMVHSTNVVYTNSSTLVRSAGAAGGSNSVTTFALFKPVSLWSDREGRAPFNSYQQTLYAGDHTNALVSGLTLIIKLSSPLGSNGVVGFNFAPVWDGETVPASTAQDWSVVIPGGLGGIVTVATNVPVWRWPGAKHMAVRNITNQNVAAGDFGVLSNSAITRLRVVGFKP